MTVDSSVYSAHFYDLLTSNDRYIIAFGSRGSGMRLNVNTLRKYN